MKWFRSYPCNDGSEIKFKFSIIHDIQIRANFFTDIDEKYKEMMNEMNKMKEDLELLSK